MQQILDALNGKKAWSRHPAVLQYRGHEFWLRCYKRVLEEVKSGRGESVKCKYHDFRARETTPPFHTQEYFDQMKRRLYSKNPEHYKQWEHLGASLENWYWSKEDNRFIKYINGKRVFNEKYYEIQCEECKYKDFCKDYYIKFAEEQGDGDIDEDITTLVKKLLLTE